ncbi:MAG: glycosyltransferase family 4 protein [Hyphomonadaceae bacterium]
MKICAIGLRGIPDVMGGIEAHCENLYPRLAKLDDTLDITVIGRAGYARSGTYGDIKVVSLWAPKKRALETLIHTPLALLYARLFLHPDVIHLHAVGPGFFAPMARLLGFRVIGTHHAADYDRPKWGRLGKWFLKSGERMMARFAEDVICVSHIIETRIAREHPTHRQNFTTIHNGAPSAGIAPATDEASSELLGALRVKPGGYILCVGRLDPTKGFHDLIEAYNRAKPNGLKLVVVGGSMGSDAYAAKLKEMASEDVIFAGVKRGNDVRTLYNHAALFVHPSYLEGFALVLLEALAADTPILASNIPEHEELGLEPVNYYAVGDVEALATQLSRPVEDFRVARRAQILEENDWDTIARRHHDIILRRAPVPAMARPVLGSRAS